MRKMQELILKEIENAVAEYDLELVVNFGATNTGTAYIMDEIETVMYFSFSFQTQYCSITIKNESDVELKTKSYLEYRKSNEIKELLAWFDAASMEYDIAKTIEMAEEDNGKPA